MEDTVDLSEDPADSIQAVLDSVEGDPRLVHMHRDPARLGSLGDVDESAASQYPNELPISPEQLWTHQVEAIARLRDGQSTVVSTGTASGKSLCYQVPAVEAAMRGRTTLMMFPTKALAHDQLSSFAAWVPKGITVAAYDGDCSMQERSWVRSNAHIILTNPEMVHVGILANHGRWERYLQRLELVVVDELHTLRGIFGSHVAHVLRRLRRVVAARSGKQPTFAFTSATIGRPQELATKLCGNEVGAVTEDGAPTGDRTTLLWNPANLGPTAEGDAPPSLNIETATIASRLITQGLRTLVFCRSRRATELVAQEIRHRVGRELSDQVRSYRAGYLANERREVELELASGAVTCVVATNAMELGIDLAGLDAVVMSGYPGTSASFRQQLGRTGRGSRSSLAVLVAGDDQLDQWMMRHPREVFRRAPEPSVINPSNPHVLHPHLGCAADEMPLRHSDEQLWPDDLDDGIRELVQQDRLLVRTVDGTRLACWSGRGAPAPTTGLRSASRGEFVIRRKDSSLVGSVDAARVPNTVHEGAIYLHQGVSYRVNELDMGRCTAFVEQSDGSVYTQAKSDTQVRLLDTEQTAIVGSMTGHLGRAEVTTQVTGYLLKDIETHRTIERVPLDLQPSVLDTTATWWVFGQDLIEAANVSDKDLPGALHAAEHAGIGILPLFAICDRWDVGGISTPWLPETDGPTIVIHDAHPGGSGVAPMAFESLREHLVATRDVLTDCPCVGGCPSCVQSPKCGNGNEPLDKAAAARLITATLDSAQTSPAPTDSDKEESGTGEPDNAEHGLEQSTHHVTTRYP